MEKGFESTLNTDTLEAEGWKGYEFWSAQLEVKEELAEYQFGVGWKAKVEISPIWTDDNRDNLYPF